MQEPKYKLSDTTPEESKAFMVDFQELLSKHSLYFEPVPQFTRKSLTSPWEIQTQIFLQRKTEIVKPEKVEDSIPSPFTDENPPATA